MKLHDLLSRTTLSKNEILAVLREKPDSKLEPNFEFKMAATFYHFPFVSS